MSRKGPLSAKCLYPIWNGERGPVFSLDWPNPAFRFIDQSMFSMLESPESRAPPLYQFLKVIPDFPVNPML